MPLRMLAPFVVASTVALFSTGVALLILGPEHGFVLGLHKASFVVWLAATGIHVLAYLWRVPALMLADWHPRDASVVGGSLARRALVAAVIVTGAILAVSTVRYAQPWVHRTAHFRHHDR